VLNNLFGNERAEAVQVLEDDRLFDKWLVEFDRSRQKHNPPGTAAKDSNKKVMSKEQYLSQFNGVVE
jgi:hypothetical protein